MVRSGLDSHHFQYTQKVHTYGVNIRYISESDSNCREMNVSSNKANASLNQYVIARRYARFSGLMSGEGLILYIGFLSVV